MHQYYPAILESSLLHFNIFSRDLWLVVTPELLLPSLFYVAMENLESNLNLLNILLEEHWIALISFLKQKEQNTK